MTFKKERIAPRQIFVCVFSVFTIFLAIKYSEPAMEGVKGAMALCVNTVIPSVFPFMVISEIVISIGVSGCLGRLFLPLLRPLFKINEYGISAFVLGTLCGFPIGARTAIGLCEQGKLSDKDVSRLLCFCNNPSSAFVINAAGLSLFGSSALGVALYAVTLFSALIVGVCVGFFSKRSLKAVGENASANLRRREGRTGIKAITSAVSDSAGAMLTVCGFIIFFSAFVSMLRNAIFPIGTPNELVAATVGFFEMTNGVACAVGTKSGETAFLLCAAAIGWSGVSVHFQIMAICKNIKLDFRPYFAAKAAQSALNVLFASAYLKIFKPSISPKLCAEIPAFLPVSEMMSKVIFVTFASFVAVLFVRKVKMRIDRKIDRNGKKTR